MAGFFEPRASVSTHPLSLALVGCGAVASGHYLPALAACKRFHVSLLVDADPARAASLAGQWGVAESATDFRRIVGRAQAAVLALPNHLHEPVAVELLSQGIHVLVEKPMATSSAACDAMIAAAEHSGAVLAVGHQFRFFDSSRWVKSALEANLLGRLSHFELRLGVISRWPFASDFFLHKETAGGGVLTDYGVHVLDLLLDWLGAPAEVAYRHDAMGGIESDCELDLAYSGGLTGFVEISRSRNLRNTCCFYGDKGSLEVGIWDPDPPLVLRLGKSKLDLHGRAREGGAPGLDFNSAFLRSLDDFADAIHGKGKPRVDGWEGRRAVDLIAGCYAHAEPLELPWMRPPELEAGP